MAERPSPSWRAAAVELLELHADHRVAGLDERQFDPEAYWDHLAAILARAPQRFRVRQVGESVEGRAIRRIDFGRGDASVLLWSQMHGNESTASRSLVDICDYLVDRPEDARVQRLEERLSVTIIPVLNPDGAARFQRHNAVGIDVNRDARSLATPEGRALKSVRDEIDAAWGFNLHDQNVRTRLGTTKNDVQIALLAPPPGTGETNDANRRAKKLASVIAEALRPVVGDSIAKYDESFNPRAFGDLMTRWGTGTVLIESGGSLQDPRKELPRRANFVAILTALDAIATAAWKDVDPQVYARLPLNGRSFRDLVLTGGSLVLPGRQPLRADLAIEFDDLLAKTGGTVSEVGDLLDIDALEVVDISELYIVPDVTVLSGEGGVHLRIGDVASAVIARDPEGREIVWRLEEGRLILVEEK